ILRPQAPFVVTFSNRMFPTKAVALWQQAGEPQRATVVETYFARSEAFDNLEVIDRSTAEGTPSDPIWAVAGRKRS
ncbi:MAG: methyltransferase type 11, partial [Gammaproteobacteria bacterium]